MVRMSIVHCLGKGLKAARDRKGQQRHRKLMRNARQESNDDVVRNMDIIKKGEGCNATGSFCAKGVRSGA